MKTINEKPSWKLLCRLEPRLAELFSEAQEIRRNRPKTFYPDNVWYHQLKDKLSALVGFSATGEGIIKSSQSYDIAYAKIHDALRGGVLRQKKLLPN